MPPKAAGESLTQVVYERLRADLLACRLQPGDRLKINDLCQAFSANLSAIREALSRLTSEGLVIAEPHRGFRVAPISNEDLHDLTRVRIEIEGLCLKRAMEIGDVRWESGVVAAFHRLSRTPERVSGDEQRGSDEWAEAHGEFHRALISACDSAWLLRIRELLYAQSERYRRLSVPLSYDRRDLNLEHQIIMNAVLARDSARALALMADHLNLTATIVVQVSEAAEAAARLRSAASA
jgi:DNA-binding GntR family transcriptional regulator